MRIKMLQLFLWLNIVHDVDAGPFYPGNYQEEVNQDVNSLITCRGTFLNKDVYHIRMEAIMQWLVLHNELPEDECFLFD